MLSLWTIVFLLSNTKDAFGLRNVVLDIQPRVVHRGGQATLRCSYDLENAPLCNVKWYRGHHEFYRYTPSELPNTKIFPFSGADVNVKMSNEHQVVLQNVSFNLSGNFSCEVTTEEPILVVMVSQDMLVVAPPERRPLISTNRNFYNIGDKLVANCTSAPSRPAAVLSFYVNNVMMCGGCKMTKNTSQELWTTEVTLEMLLFPSNFDNGRVILRCEAQVANLFRQETELILANPKDPVPQRVTSSNLAAPSLRSYFSLTSLILGYILCFVSITR